jgi:hypothetical protein
MTQVMNVTSRQTGPLPPPWVGHLWERAMARVIKLYFMRHSRNYSHSFTPLSHFHFPSLRQSHSRHCLIGTTGSKSNAEFMSKECTALQ